MGITDFFKKKEPEMNFDANLGLSPGTDLNSGLGQDFSNPGMDSMNQGFANNFSQGYHDQLQPSTNLSSQQFQPVQQSQGNDLQKDIQILSLKLDAIKAELDSINQRIKNIETIAEKEQIGQPKKWY